jgi:hypothetical protein
VRADPPQKYGELAHESAVAMIDFMRANKQIEGPLDPKDVYTNQFVNAANAVDPATVKAIAASLPK